MPLPPVWAQRPCARPGEGLEELADFQSHDVGLCEYSRWQGDRMAPLDRLEDKHNFTWGAIGYNHLDAAEEQGQEVLTSSLEYHRRATSTRNRRKQGQLAVTVFNPCAWERTDLATTGRIYPIPANAKDIVVRDRPGRLVPSQIIKSDKDEPGNLRGCRRGLPGRESSQRRIRHLLSGIHCPKPPRLPPRICASMSTS